MSNINMKLTLTCVSKRTIPVGHSDKPFDMVTVSGHSDVILHQVRTI